jgi:histone-lysine N-methyltransferase SETMAR
MSSNVEYRSVIKFLVLKDTESKSIIQQLQDVYKNQCPSRSTIYNWIGEFKRGRQSVFDEEREGRPCEISDEKRELCQKIVLSERRISIRELAQRLHISTFSTHAILKEFGIRKLCSRFVPKFISGEMAANRLACCESNLKLYDKYGDAFLQNIVTEDETPISLYVPESKRDSAEWRMASEAAPRKLRSGTSHGRAAMLTVFWNIRGIIKIDFLDRKATMNSQYYSELMRDVRKRQRKSPSIPLWLLHDNAPIHTSNLSMTTTAECGFQLVAHPPYSPDLAPSDFVLFRHLKQHLKGHRFESAIELKEEVEKILTSLSQNFFENAFVELLRRWKRCVEENGSYIEK